MGPIIQCIFVYLVYLFKIDVSNDFYYYHYFILIFNLLPIYPLDGGRLVNIMLSLIFSYYNSLKWIIYFSYFLYLGLCIYFIFIKFNLILFIILLLLGIKVLKEIKKADYYYEKFLIERYLKDFNFKKKKKIKNIKEMKRDYYHYIIKDHSIIYEKKMLNDFFIN